MSKLIIGIPTYGNKNGLIDVLMCLKRQSYEDIKIVVSENEPTSDYVPPKDISLYYKQDTNIGLENNFNFVYENSPKSDYFKWMADDDKISANYIRNCIEFLDKNKDYIICSGKGIMLPSYETSEKIVSITSDVPLFRIFKYLFKVKKNAVIYGVIRNDSVLPRIETCIGSDWAFMCNLLLKGKLMVLDSCEIYKDENGSTSSRQKMVKTWNATGLKKVFFETYTAYKISSLIKVNLFIKISIFFFLNCKFLFNSIKRRV